MVLLHAVEHFLLVESVVAERKAIGAHFKKLARMRTCQPKAIRRVLRVDDDEVDCAFAAQSRQDGMNCLPPRLSDHISKVKQSHASPICIAIGNNKRIRRKTVGGRESLPRASLAASPSRSRFSNNHSRFGDNCIEALIVCITRNRRVFLIRIGESDSNRASGSVFTPGTQDLKGPVVEPSPVSEPGAARIERNDRDNQQIRFNKIPAFRNGRAERVPDQRDTRNPLPELEWQSWTANDRDADNRIEFC